MSITEKQCKVEGCKSLGILDKNGKRYLAKGYCQKHYLRVHRHRTPFISNGRRTPEKHSMTGTPEYRVWIAMKQRCNDKNASNYHKYGGKGIKVCDRWNDSFIAFYSDMGKRPDGHSIDRIDGSRGYEPGNCRWADIYTQNRNRKFNRV